ncbi:hypothetical protein [Rhizobium leguminosarum]|uniref:hypothetical protein n=1 Tax=Rhizobium leguminosarum TaxID=384 RepID=UPI001C9730AA|nr:hypothetical protein [Rhizobium leguminosarum]MBY5608731.1 hypothetical protein [Rhizobium leguminosarum]MBY5657304.1 hypothetical protein [Rhizobium leguminosarum]
MIEQSISFAAIATLLAGTIFQINALIDSIKRRANPKKITAIIFMILALCLALAFSFIIVSPASMLSDDRWFLQSPWVEIWLFLSMSCGMLSSYLKIEIEQRRTIIAQKAAKGDHSYTHITIDKWDMIYPFLVSVITFGAVLQAFGSRALDISQVIIAFQTGFFWQTILPRARPVNDNVKLDRSLS